MDDDDGMILNISTGPVPQVASLVAPVVTGGRWTDRLKAKRSAKGISSKVGSDSNSIDVKSGRTFNTGEREKSREKSKEKVYGPDGFTIKPPSLKDSRVSKKPLKPRSDRSQSEKTLKNPSGKPKVGKIKPNFDDDGKTFVSSIFSSNPSVEKESEEPDITAAGAASNAPLKDTSTFEGLQLNPRLCKTLNDHLHMKGPTGIQRSVIPRLVERDRDLFVQAQTGSGKTLSYVLPLLQRIMASSELTPISRDSGLFAVILAPTRELTTQIYDVIELVCAKACHWLVPGIVIGGEKKKSEKARIRKGINILVATPGRLADHFDNTTSLDLSNVRWFILDEGDRLMDLGFEETITKILGTIKSKANFRHFKTLPSKQVNVICSATMKGNVKRLGEISLRDAEWVSAESTSSVQDAQTEDSLIDLSVPDQLIQKVVVTPAKLRLITLASILIGLSEKISKNDEEKRAMVFLSCSDSVDFHFKLFTRSEDDADSDDDDDSDDEDNDKDSVVTIKRSPLLNNVTVYKLHGSLTQHARTKTLNEFKKDKNASILLCTDVASRGLDLPLITHVIEYDPPFSKDDHIHRVGRTARAGKNGTSILFLLPSETEYLKVLDPMHKSGIQNVPYQALLQQAFKETWETDATTWHLNAERWLLRDSGALAKAQRAFSSHIRAYATHGSGEKAIFNVKTLHLGHIAKSFGLRDPPGHQQNKKKKPSSGSDPTANRKRMLATARKMDALSEFNIGV